MKVATAGQVRRMGLTGAREFGYTGLSVDGYDRHPTWLQRTEHVANAGKECMPGYEPLRYPGQVVAVLLAKVCDRLEPQLHVTREPAPSNFGMRKVEHLPRDVESHGRGPREPLDETDRNCPDADSHVEEAPTSRRKDGRNLRHLRQQQVGDDVPPRDRSPVQRRGASRDLRRSSRCSGPWRAEAPAARGSGSSRPRPGSCRTAGR